MSFLRRLYYSLPPHLRFLARRLYFLPVDLYEGLAGRRDELTPPRGLIYTGSGDFKEQGRKLLEYFIKYGGLQPHHHVLDVGSGIGRAAVPLTGYLDSRGSYEGFDVVKTGVDWCRKRISTRFPNFNFRFIPLDNDLYRSGGARASTFEFPYPDGRFDFVILTSVFTHMLPDEVANYLREIRRGLKPGGTCFATFFLWNEDTARLSESNKAFRFPHDHGFFRLMDEQVQSANVAFDETHLKKEMIEKAGLSIRSTFYGYWRGLPKEECLDFQDIVVMGR